MTKKSGTLYGVGTGPGDPELVTRKAWHLIENADVIAYPEPEGGNSFAFDIVREAVKPNALLINISVPMTSGRSPAQSIYDEAAAAIQSQLEQGKDVVVLCEGDPLFYGSFMYLLARLRENFHTEIIPGVTSMTACAAAHNHALVARNDSLIVLPATLDEDLFAERLECAEAVVIMKIGRNMKKIRAILEAKNLAENALYVSHASLPHQAAMPLNQAPDDAPYFSIILIYKGHDPWI